LYLAFVIATSDYVRAFVVFLGGVGTLSEPILNESTGTLGSMFWPYAHWLILSMLFYLIVSHQ
jgi:predicted Rossmann-fold nucleotide-binding protein